MASSSTRIVNTILYNNDSSMLLVGASDGLFVFSTRPFKYICNAMPWLNVQHAQIWGCSSLVAVVGTSSSPITTPKTVTLFDINDGIIIKQLSFHFVIEDFGFTKHTLILLSKYFVDVYELPSLSLLLRESITTGLSEKGKISLSTSFDSDQFCFSGGFLDPTCPCRLRVVEKHSTQLFDESKSKYLKARIPDEVYMTSSSIINRENSENKCEEDEEKDSKDEENDDDSTKFSHYKEKVGNWKGCLCSFVSNTSDLVDLFRSTKEKEMKRIQREKDQFSSENAHEIGKSSKSYNTSEDPENPAASKQKKKKKKKRGLLEALSSNLSEAKESHIEECSKPEKLTAKAAEEGIREESNSNEDDEMDENKDIVEVFGYKLKRKDIMTEIPSVTHSPLPQICQPQADPRSQVIIAFASQCSPPFVDVRAASASLPDFHQTSSAHPHDSLLASPLGPLSTCPQFLLSVLTFPLIIVQSDKNPFPSVSLLSLSGNGRWVAAAFDDSPYFMLFDTVALTSFVLQRGKYPASILSICFGEHDGMYFAAQTLKGTVHIWKKIKTTFRLSTQNEVDGMDNEQEEHERETHDTKAKEEHSIDYTTSDREIEAIEEMKEREKIKNCDVEYWPTGKTSRHCRAKKLKKSAIAFTSDASKLILCQVPEDGLASVRQFRMADEEADLSCVQENNLWRYPLPPSK